MEAKIIRTSDYSRKTAYNRTFTSLNELLDFIDAESDTSDGVVIFKQDGEWVVEIYDDYRK